MARASIVGFADMYTGPVVLAPEELRKRWSRKFTFAQSRQIEKAEGPPGGSVRARPLAIDGCEVLVFNHSNPTRFVAAAKNGGMFVRLDNHADSDFDGDDPKELAAALEIDVCAVPEKRYKKSPKTLRVADRNLALFVVDIMEEEDEDEYKGNGFKRSVVVDLAPGTYVIDVKEHVIGDRRLELVRMRLGGRALVMPVPSARTLAKQRPTLRVGVTAESRRLGAKLRWVSTEGGPLVVVARESAGAWHGTDARKGERSHYDLASANPSGVATVGVTPSVEALTLGGPTPTTWIPHGQGGLLVRSDHDSEADEDIQNISRATLALAAPTAKFVKTKVRLTTGPSGELFVFDAAVTGSNRKTSRLSARLRPGTYEVDVLGKLAGDVTHGADVDAARVSIIRLRPAR